MKKHGGALALLLGVPDREDGVSKELKGFADDVLESFKDDDRDAFCKALIGAVKECMKKCKEDDEDDDSEDEEEGYES